MIKPTLFNPTALAPYSVPIFTPSRAGTANGSKVFTLCSKVAKLISSSISRLLLLEAPSVPKPTQTPAFNNCGTGATPLASFILLPGLCATRTLYFFII